MVEVVEMRDDAVFIWTDHFRSIATTKKLADRQTPNCRGSELGTIKKVPRIYLKEYVNHNNTVLCFCLRNRL